MTDSAPTEPSERMLAAGYEAAMKALDEYQAATIAARGQRWSTREVKARNLAHAKATGVCIVVRQLENIALETASDAITLLDELISAAGLYYRE
jgi:hypothetical protein